MSCMVSEPFRLFLQPCPEPVPRLGIVCFLARISNASPWNQVLKTGISYCGLGVTRRHGPSAIGRCKPQYTPFH